MNAASWFCLGLPLAGSIAITLAGTRISRRAAGYISTLTTMGAFVAAIVVFAKLLGESPQQRSHDTTAWTWLSAGPYHFGLTLLNDPLSSMMMLIVTGVGSLIIAYSVGYMDGADEERRFFAYMSLFVFSMLLLVQTQNLLLLLAGWGMVGLSSYLLIGFHQDRPSAIAAAKKAFVMNAFGDATFAIALFLLIEHTGHLDFTGAFAGAPHGGTVATLIALGLLGGAVAKSAQIPLHTWLPDAMEGPTPVSALIHAATMVVAGVYLIVRTHVLFENAPHIQDLAAGLGAATLLMAGVIALVQNDIKRVIAYSTMSQIGYMFVGAAGGAYANGMFHLMTHAFFKALLFLAGGIVIHALTGEQDIRRMGGLGRRMPHTRTAFLIGSLALVGVPPFAGFFSKDSIIAAMLNRGTFGVALAFCALVGTFLTGVYAFRLYFVVFHGQQSEYAREHLHADGHGREGPFSMVWTVTALALLSAIGGFIQFAPFWHPVSDWLEHVAPPFAVATNTQEAVASVSAVVFGLAGIYTAWLYYGAKTAVISKELRAFAPVAEHKFYWDELYDWVFYRPAVLLAESLGRFVERPLIAGSIREVTQGFGFGSREVRRLQTGLVRSYALALASGLAVLAVVFLSTR
jgi:NADH-quinone oxidoreductase subunit L